MTRAYYAASINLFQKADPLSILGILADQHGFSLEEQQKLAWKSQIQILQSSLQGISGHLFIEFLIPRMGKRVDAVIISHGIIFVVEFKVGETQYRADAINQVYDYALDLKNFHASSHKVPLVPILVATNAKYNKQELQNTGDGVYKPLKSNTISFSEVLKLCINSIPGVEIDPFVWENGQYMPTPTIIESAQALYNNHDVREISRSDAGARNLTITSDAIDEIIETAKREQKKVICFITGVPGAGKTLAGLNIANRRLAISNDDHTVFLSGNGPLVNVLREALIRDDLHKGANRKNSARKANAFIQNIHHFRDEYLRNPNPPLERVVIFDEAQRAWTREEATRFMRQKRGISDFNLSEPEFLIGVMDRHQGWAVVVCLVGGGQEINRGEAGLSEWFFALQKHYPNWSVYVSNQIFDSEFLNGDQDFILFSSKQIKFDDRLHLSVSIRSFRSENVSRLVKAILDCDLSTAKGLFSQVIKTYPILLTRDLSKAREWIKSKARGTERYGILASSGANRLRPEGIFVNAEIEVENWFLNDQQDVRSSFALEGVATEFDIQGLELDWTIVAWDADLRFHDGSWDYKIFKGTKWQSINDPIRRNYLKNTYRVLLTRARQGMVIFVPSGNEEDSTRLPSFYDGIFNYLKEIGLQEI